MRVLTGDIEKIRLIHNIKNNFQYTDKIVENFIEQIEEESKKENVQRFFRGYKIEDNFQRLFSWFSETSLIHNLEEKQSPTISKLFYQVPDYMLFYETATEEIKPILLEVKSMAGQKESLKLMKKQVLLLHNYANILNRPLLFAVYWTKLNTWTLNTIDQFEEKEKIFKISILKAIKNDISIILGDVFHIIPPVFRKIVFDKSINNNSKVDLLNGNVNIKRCELSTDGIHYEEIEIIESMMLDFSVKMKQVSVQENELYKEVIEQSDETYYVKLSNQILTLLPVLKDALKKDVIPAAALYILKFMGKMDFAESYVIPEEKTPATDKLIKEAFKNTDFLNNYMNSQA